jgi:hypothetical protein
MIGLNINMGLDSWDEYIAQGMGENPKVTALKSELKQKFPIGDCVTLDISIKKAKELVPQIFLEKAGGNYKVESVPKPKSGGSYAQIQLYQKAYDDRAFYINRMSEILPQYILKLENEFDKQKCRDSFEEKRTRDMAEVLTKQATLQEKSVLAPNYKEQYIYIGIGAVVLLLGLYVVSRK